MARNQAIIPARRASTGARLPLPDARGYLALKAARAGETAWPGPDFWRGVLAYPDWWWTTNLPPVPRHNLAEARHLRLILGLSSHARNCCPYPRPLRCDRFAPQEYHAHRHSSRCLAYRNTPTARAPQHREKVTA